MTSASAVSRIISKLGIARSEESRGRVSTVCSEGYQVRKNTRDEIIVSYVNRTASLFTDKMNNEFLGRQAEAEARIHVELLAKGFTVSYNEDGNFIVSKAGN